MRVSVLCALAAVLLPPRDGMAQKLEPRPLPQRNVESFALQSPSLGYRLDITVGMPANFKPEPGKKYPALLVTDGNVLFQTALDGVRNLAGVIVPLYVVSIGSPFEDGDSTWTRRRVYEFSPPNWAMQDPFGKLVSGLCQQYGVKVENCTGGAPKFLNFIRNELLPLLYQRFPIDPGQLGLFGLSAGGFFAAYTIFQAESPFRKYIISSPAMAYGDDEIFRQEEKYAAEHKDLPVGIYMASGSLEMDDPMLEGIGKIVSGQTHLAAALRARKYPGLSLTVEIHHGLGHSDAAPTTLARGLRTLYAQ